MNRVTLKTSFGLLAEWFLFIDAEDMCQANLPLVRWTKSSWRVMVPYLVGTLESYLPDIESLALSLWRNTSRGAQEWTPCHIVYLLRAALTDGLVPRQEVTFRLCLA